jgi:hypothetical protein
MGVKRVARKINCPVLKGWHSLPWCAIELSISRQSMFQKAEDGELSSLCWLPGGAERPAAYVISTAELDRLRAEQAAARAAAAARALATAARAKEREPSALAS